MNFGRYVGATLALFAFFFFYNWLVNGYLLMGMYDETARVWRSMAEMKANMPMHMAFQFVLAAWLAFVFTQLFREGGVQKGLLFGLYFGVFAGILMATFYIWLPIPTKLAGSWLASWIVEGLGGGFVLGSIYRR